MEGYNDETFVVNFDREREEQKMLVWDIICHKHNVPHDLKLWLSDTFLWPQGKIWRIQHVAMDRLTWRQKSALKYWNMMRRDHEYVFKVVVGFYVLMFVVCATIQTVIGRDFTSTESEALLISIVFPPWIIHLLMYCHVPCKSKDFISKLRDRASIYNCQMKNAYDKLLANCPYVQDEKDIERGKPFPDEVYQWFKEDFQGQWLEEEFILLEKEQKELNKYEREYGVQFI